MSIRYGIDLVLQPSFTAKVHLTRKILCDQYSSWVTERQPIRVHLTPYFPCSDNQLTILERQVENIAQETVAHKPYMLRRSAFLAIPSVNGVDMEFEAPEPVLELQRKAMEAAQYHSSRIVPTTDFRPRIALLQYGEFPKTILVDAARFAEGVADGLDMPEMALPWRLLLTRYSSESAGEDWGNGRWASDISFCQIQSHQIYADVGSVFELLRMVKEKPGRGAGGQRGIGRFFGMG